MSTDFNNFFAVDSNGIVAIRSSFNFLRCVERDSTGAGTLWFLSVHGDRYVVVLVSAQRQVRCGSCQ